MLLHLGRRVLTFFVPLIGGKVIMGMSVSFAFKQTCAMAHVVLLDKI